MDRTCGMRTNHSSTERRSTRDTTASSWLARSRANQRRLLKFQEELQAQYGELDQLDVIADERVTPAEMTSRRQAVDRQRALLKTIADRYTRPMGIMTDPADPLSDWQSPFDAAGDRDLHGCTSSGRHNDDGVLLGTESADEEEKPRLPRSNKRVDSPRDNSDEHADSERNFLANDSLRDTSPIDEDPIRDDGADAPAAGDKRLLKTMQMQISQLQRDFSGRKGNLKSIGKELSSNRELTEKLKSEKLQKLAERLIKAAGITKWRRGIRNATSAIFGRATLRASSVSGRVAATKDGPPLPPLDKSKMRLLYSAFNNVFPKPTVPGGAQRRRPGRPPSAAFNVTESKIRKVVHLYCLTLRSRAERGLDYDAELSSPAADGPPEEFDTNGRSIDDDDDNQEEEEGDDEDSEGTRDVVENHIELDDASSSTGGYAAMSIQMRALQAQISQLQRGFAGQDGNLNTIGEKLAVRRSLTELETLQKVAEVQFKAAGLRKWTRGVRNAATAIFGKKILSASTVSGKLKTANDGPVLPGLDKNKMGVLFDAFHTAFPDPTLPRGAKRRKPGAPPSAEYTVTTAAVKHVLATLCNELRKKQGAGALSGDDEGPYRDDDDEPSVETYDVEADKNSGEAEEDSEEEPDERTRPSKRSRQSAFWAHSVAGRARR